MRPIVSLFCLIALAFVAVPQRLAADPADIAAAARGVVRVVLISNDEDGVGLVGHGSGFAVGPNLVVTNAHVVEPLINDQTMRIGVVPSQGKSGYYARVIAYSPRNDLALLKLSEAGTLAPSTLFTGAVSDGQDVWAVGYPGNVDVAQGFSAADYMAPTQPVKTHGNISSGRSNRQFDTLLHTAQIASGNSGGPLLDACGRVMGANSYGTQAASVADSSFYFAVSMREISRFLLANGVKPAMTGEPCRSQAEFLSAEEQRLADEKTTADEVTRADADKQDAALARATRLAELDVIASRENRMALAGLALLLALLAGGTAFVMGQQNKVRERKIAMIAAGALLIGAVVAWFSRPAISEIDSRAKEMAASQLPTGAASETLSSTSDNASAMICVIDAARSRITVSPTTDVPVNWGADGCVNTKTQYGLAGDGWSRILAPNSEDTVTIAAYDPAARAYVTDRYLLDAETMAKVRLARGKYKPPSCGGGEAAARQLGDAQAAVKGLLPGQPNERLVYKCSAGH